MASSWIRHGTALLAILLVARCGTSSDVTDVEDMLVERFLDPLAAGGITASIEGACRYPGSVDAPWHLKVELHLDASPRNGADVLVGEGMIVRPDREPMIVQQVPDGPNEGWNGGLTASDSGSVLGLTYNNATRSGWSGAVGWAEECSMAPASVE